MDLSARVLAHWEGLGEAAVERIGGGLINETFLVRAPTGRLVLQRVNRIFDPIIHENIRAVTARLAAAGLPTPRLVPTADGRPYLDLGAEGVWRVMTHVEGVIFPAARSPAQARAAGALIARFHGALDGLEHTFRGMRPGVHDTARHLRRLREAVAAGAGHRLHEEVRALAAEIEADAAALPPLPALPPRICHGDAKFENFLFAGAEPPAAERAVCLIDLDTVGPMALAFELGDALRSWCNRSGEDAPAAAFDFEIFRAAVQGYLADLGRPLSEEERRAILLGPDWVSLELAARFATDALEETYFRWDPARFPGRGEHDLVRARGQHSLHRALVLTRRARAEVLGIA